MPPSRSRQKRRKKKRAHKSGSKTQQGNSQKSRPAQDGASSSSLLPQYSCLKDRPAQDDSSSSSSSLSQNSWLEDILARDDPSSSSSLPQYNCLTDRLAQDDSGCTLALCLSPNSRNAVAEDIKRTMEKYENNDGSSSSASAQDNRQTDRPGQNVGSSSSALSPSPDSRRVSADGSSVEQNNLCLKVTEDCLKTRRVYFTAKPQGRKKRETLTPDEVDKVSKLVSRCLKSHMSKEDTVSTLYQTAGVEPLFTHTVWDRMERDNPDYFNHYRLKLLLNDLVATFKGLLKLEKALVSKLPSAEVEDATSTQDRTHRMRGGQVEPAADSMSDSTSTEVD